MSIAYISLDLKTISGSTIEQRKNKMKLVPGPLPPIPTNNTMDRIPLSLPFNTDLLWRYPLGFHSLQPPSSPLMDYKSQLPTSLAGDPRVWSREDVATFLRWAEREFDLQPIDMDMFQMNGKAMCLLTRTDLSERAPGSGDVLHNVLQILVRDANNLQRMLPSSPVTPTSRHPYPLSPHSHPPTPTWNILSQTAAASVAAAESFHSQHAASLAAHLMAQNHSVTLSPAPSVDSQAGSPQHDNNHHSIFGNGSNGGGSSNSSANNNPSDSDEDGYDLKNNTSPPNTPSYLIPQMSHMAPRSPKEAASSPGAFKFVGKEFFPNDTAEPNTNGRLLWDFLQQLLNDPAQRYTSYIAWKNRETGVFKIVDPAGLAKLWGIQKNHLSMNYDKMSRALRYYYRVNILRKVQGERHCYQFLRNPTELKNIKNISLLRQQMSPTSSSNSNTTSSATKLTSQVTIKPEITIQPEVSIKPEPFDNSVENEASSSSVTVTAASTTIPNHFQRGSSTGSSTSSNNSAPSLDDKPTDLSMDAPTDLSSHSSRHVNIVCSPDQPLTGGLH